MFGSSAIDASTRLCAVYGHPIRHSASPAMQNAAFAALGINWRYLAFDVPPEHLAAAIQGAKIMGFLGLNLTVPHKLLALHLVDVLDDSARRWGAVNTIRFEGQGTDGQWQPLDCLTEGPSNLRARGFNTDADAIIQSLREDLATEFPGGTVLLLGAGGAGRAAALRLAAERVDHLYLVNRTRQKAVELAEEIARTHPGLSVTVGYPPGTVDLVLNATSLGLKPGDPLPFNPECFDLSRTRAVYDMIYRPAETPLLAAARAAGVKTSNGLGMLLYQGAKALELWSGKPAPVTVMREALRKAVYD